MIMQPRRHYLPAGRATLESIVLKQETSTTTPLGTTTDVIPTPWQDIINTTSDNLKPGNIYQLWQHAETGEIVEVILDSEHCYDSAAGHHPFVSCEWFMRVCYRSRTGAVMMDDEAWTDNQRSAQLAELAKSDAADRERLNELYAQGFVIE